MRRISNLLSIISICESSSHCQVFNNLGDQLFARSEPKAGFNKCPVFATRLVAVP